MRSSKRRGLDGGDHRTHPEPHHLKLLAAVSRLLHDAGCRARLLDAPDQRLLETLRLEEARASNPSLGRWPTVSLGTTS